MRISDWSSDVCSSDLGSPLATAGVLVLLPLPGPLTTALVLMAAAPPILSAAPIAMILGLDGALALVVGLIATLLTQLTRPEARRVGQEGTSTCRSRWSPSH